MSNRKVFDLLPEDGAKALLLCALAPPCGISGEALLVLFFEISQSFEYKLLLSLLSSWDQDVAKAPLFYLYL